METHRNEETRATEEELSRVAMRYRRASSGARTGDQHRAEPGSQAVGSSYRLDRADVCAGRLRTAYIRPERTKWTAIGIVCESCFTVWPRPSDA